MFGQGVSANLDQAAHWNGAGGELWVREQERMDAQFAPFLDPVLTTTQLPDGAAVLDVGCGCGALSLAAAAQEPERQVLGIDLSEGMLERARQRAAEAGVAGRVSFLHRDAQVMDFAAPWCDAVISRFGVMFFADPVAAFVSIRRAVRPGGQLVFVCWAAARDNPWYQLPQKVAAAHVPPLEIGPAGAPGPFGLDDRDRITTLLTAAGWVGITIVGFRGHLRLGGGLKPAAAGAFALGQRSLKVMLDGRPEPVVAKVLDDLERELGRHLIDGVVALPFSTWVVSARA